MKNKTVFIIAIISFMILTTGLMNGEERPIYVGDIIELNIDSSTYSLVDIEIAFEDFEIVDLIEVEEVYELKIRSFDVGEHIVTLGNTEVVISITTLLNDDKTELMPGELALKEPGFILPWTAIKFISLAISLIGIVTLIILIIKNRPLKPLSIYETLKVQLNDISLLSDDYAYHLITVFKTYISKQFSEPFIGLTTKELLFHIKGYPEVKESYELMSLWLNKCDTFNYSKDKANLESKTLLKEELITIVESIEENSEVSE